MLHTYNHTPTNNKVWPWKFSILSKTNYFCQKIMHTVYNELIYQWMGSPTFLYYWCINCILQIMKDDDAMLSNHFIELISYYIVRTNHQLNFLFYHRYFLFEESLRESNRARFSKILYSAQFKLYSSKLDSYNNIWS